MDLADCLKLYDRTYFSGGRAVSGYDEYENCRGVLKTWSTMVEVLFQPQSVLDVGAAYGFVVEYFLRKGVEAVGVEPSAYARSQAKVDILDGSLPDLPIDLGKQFDVVLGTELMEHVPEQLVPASLQRMANHTKNFLVLLIMLEGPGADGDIGHVCLKSKEWWNEQLDKTGLVRRQDAEDALDAHSYSRHMAWSGRFFVRERASA